jgi:Eukaryotic mitochondrial regulator protein
MAQWLATIGYPNFGKPLAGSTNYMSAYGRDGTLMRAPNQTPSRRAESSEKLMGPAAGAVETADEANARRDAEHRLTKAGEEMGAENRIPQERMQDLRPFKLNTNFYSQPVLGEDLREAIYDMVVEQGKSVRATSAWFNVTMERVAAVVRMKTMERDWVKQVSFSLFPFRSNASAYPYMMKEKKFDWSLRHPSGTWFTFQPTSLTPISSYLLLPNSPQANS